MRLTESELEKAAQAAFAHYYGGDWKTRYESESVRCAWRSIVTAAFAAVEPTQVDVPGDLVERMLRAFDEAKDQDYNSSPSERRVCMTAALRVALDEIEERAKKAAVPCEKLWRNSGSDFITDVFSEMRKWILKKPDLAVDVVREKLKWYGSSYAEEVDAEKIVALVREADAKERDKIR